MITNRTVIAAALGAVASFAFAANPLGFAEYEQTVTAEFETPAAAESATLRVAELPEACPQVFTVRWDDSNPAHVEKGAMMAENGFRANFYLNGGACDYLRDYASKMLAQGHALGNHTASHPYMMEISANAAWSEIMMEKIAIESALSTPCVAYAAPFGWTATLDSDRGPLIIRMLQASGHYVCDDNPVCKPEWRCATNAWFETVRFGADDRNPSKAEYDKQFANAVKNLARQPQIGRMTFGVHSWCDAAGTRLQGELLSATRKAHPDWYYCHANAFGAYRYSARFAHIRKLKTVGARATWSVTRFDPIDLGDGIPLSLLFSASPKACALPKGRNGTFALAHGRPTSFTAADSSKIAMTVQPDEKKGVLRVSIANGTSSPLEGVRLVACLPPVWQCQRQALDVGTVPAGGKIERAFALGERSRPDYAEGDALYAVSADFTSAGGRRRAWATATVKGAAGMKGTPRDTCLVMGPFDATKFNGNTWLAASVPGADLPDVGSAKNERWITLTDPSRLPASVYVNMPYGPLFDREYRELSGPFVGEKGARLFAVEFSAPDDGSGELLTSINPRFHNPVVYLNGVKMPFTGSPMRLSVKRGINRMIVRADLEQDRYPSSEQLTVCRGGLPNPFFFQRVRAPSKAPDSVTDWLNVQPAEAILIGGRSFNAEFFLDHWRVSTRYGRGATSPLRGWPKRLPNGGHEFMGTWKAGMNLWSFAERLAVTDAHHASFVFEVRSPVPADVDCLWLKGIFTNDAWRKSPATFDGKRIGLDGKRRIVLPDVKAISLPAKGGRVVMRGDFAVGIEDISKTSYAPDSLCVQIMAKDCCGRGVSRIGMKMDLSFEPDAGTQLDLGSAMNFRLADDVSGDGKGGWSDQGPDNDMRILPTGNLVCDNVVFRIAKPSENGGKACISLGGAHSPKLPRHAFATFASPVAGNWLNILHAVAFPVWDGKPTGTVIVRFADGSEQMIPIVCGTNVGNFWNAADQKETVVGWSGNNASSRVGLHVSRFHLDKSGIVSLAFESRMDGATWMILAATVTEDRVPSALKRKFVLEAGTEWRPISSETSVMPGSALDFSFLLDAPAGKYGRIVPDGNGHLSFERTGKRIRLNGANLCFDANFLPDKKSIDRMADDFSRLGYNFVRFHHYDGALLKRGGGYMEFDPAKLDNFDYTLAAMKKRGIYATMDLFIHRDANIWPVKGYEGKQVDRGSHKALVWGDEGFRTQFLDYARNLMTHRNRYTGLTWGEDPAIVNLDCVNEDAVTWTVNCPFAKPVFERHFTDWIGRNGIADDEVRHDRPRLWNAFLCDFYPESYRKTATALREMGVRHLLTDQNHGHAILGMITREPYDLVENHFYHAHPRTIKGTWGLPAVCDTGSSKRTLERELMCMSLTRRMGVPFTITEWDYVSPNPYASEGALMCSAYAALQDWDGLNRFAWEHRKEPLLRGEGVPEWFNIARDPMRQMTERISACLFTRGDVKASDVSVPILVSRKHFNEQSAKEDVELLGLRIGLVARTGNVLFTPGEKLRLPFGTRAVLTVDKAGEKAAEEAGIVHLDSNDHQNGFKTLALNGILSASAEDAAEGCYRSSTGELEIRSKASSFKVVTPRSEAFSLESGSHEKGRFADVAIRRSQGVFFITALGDDSLVDAKRYLLVHATRQLASGMEFESDEMAVQLTHGKTPLLVRCGEAEVTLDRDLTGYALYALCSDGTRNAMVPMSVRNGKTRFALSTEKAIAYELVKNN